MTSIKIKYIFLILIIEIIVIFLPTIIGYRVALPIQTFFLGVATSILGIILYNSLKLKNAK